MVFYAHYCHNILNCGAEGNKLATVGYDLHSKQAQKSRHEGWKL